MQQKYVVRIVLIIAFALMVIFGISEYVDMRKAEIEREREVEVQIQKTERTEERSQFWQKIIPWGDDEAEENE